MSPQPSSARSWRRDPALPRLERLGDRGPPRLEPRASSSSPSPCTACSRPPTTPSSGTPVTRPTSTSSSPAARTGSPGLRQGGGMSGYPNRAESEHDLVENSHASTALSYAYGLATAGRLRSDPRRVVAVVGDGALTGGVAYEALNNIGVFGRERRHRPQRQRAFVRADGVADLVRRRLGGTGAGGSSPAPGPRRRGTSSRRWASAISARWTATISTRSNGRCRAWPAYPDQSCCTCTRPRAAATGRPSSTRRSAFTTSAPSIRRRASPSRPRGRRLSYTEAFSSAIVREAARAPRDRGHHRRHARADGAARVPGALPGTLLRRRHRRAARRQRGRRHGHGRVATGRRDLLDLPQSVPGTRSITTSVSTACRWSSAWTGRASPATTGRATTACST